MGEENKDGLLRLVTFNPSKSVTYRPIPQKQMAEVLMTNNEKTPVIFKWKSTRPGIYKMRPVYGVIGIGEKISVRLFCKGVGAKETCPTSDRYTCVLASSPSSNVNAEAIWSNIKYQKKLAQTGKMKKVKLNVLYQGVNDQEPPKHEEGEEDENEKDRVGTMQKKKAKETESKKKMPVIVMFTRKEESLSGEDENDVTKDEDQKDKEKDKEKDKTTKEKKDKDNDKEKEKPKDEKK